MKICCVIVTYNRKQLLIESIKSVLNQTYEVEDILVIDNNSTDGTGEFLIENNLMNKISYHKLESNIGGAGGFNEGIKESLKKQYDWVWIMDDDSVPTNTALENLIISLDELKNEKISFLCSKVIGPDSEEMNIPLVSERIGENGYPLWMKYLDKGIIEVKAATFVSVLINFEAIKRVGLPWKQFFIWGDDIEYTLRLTRYFGVGYSIGKSIVIHKRIGAKNLSILQESNINRIKMYNYKYRNDIFLYSYNTKNKAIILTVKQFIEAFKVLIKSKSFRIRKFYIIISSTLNGIFNIKLRKEFKNRMIIE